MLKDDANKLYTLTGDADAYVFSFTDGTAMIYVDADGVIDMTAQAALNSDTASYTVVDSGATKTYASMTYATGTTPTYTFAADTAATGEVADIKSITLNAAGATVVTSFAAAVTATAADSATFVVNSQNYVAAAGAIEIAAAADGTTSTLTNGTVNLTGGATNSVVKTTGATTVEGDSKEISAAGTSAITVKVTGGESAETVVIGDLDETEGFTAAGTSYEMTAGKYLVDASDSQIYTITDKTYTLGTTGETYIALDASSNLVLTDAAIESGTYVVVNNAKSEVYQSLTIAIDETAGNTYTFATGAESANTAIAEIQLGAVDATVSGVTFATNVTTPANGTNTYTIGSTEYTASSDALTIAVTTGDVSSLSAGTIEIGAETLAITGDSDGVVVTGDTSVRVHAVAGADGAASTVDSITNLTNAGKVVYAGSTYEMVGTVLKITAADSTVRYYDYASSDTSEAANILQAPASNIAYVQIIGGNVNLKSGADLITGEITKVIYGVEENYVGNSVVELQNNNGTYALTQGANYTTENAATVDATGMDTAAALALTTAFNATVTAAQNANVTVNGISYAEAGSGTLRIAATYTASETEGEADTASATLTAGIVLLTPGGNTASVTSTNGQSASATVNPIQVSVDGSNIITILAIDTSDTFVYNATAADDTKAQTYTMADVGLLISGENIWDSTVTIDATNGRVAIDALTSDANWTKMIAVSDSTLTLTDVSDAKLIIVDNTANPTKNYGNVTFDATAGYTVTVTDATNAADIATIELGANAAKLTTAGLATVAVTAGGTPADGTDFTAFTVNGKDYNATNALAITATAGTATDSTLTSGTVVLNADVTSVTGSTTADGARKTATIASGTVANVTVADGAVTEVSGLGVNESFSVTDVADATVVYTVTAANMLKDDANKLYTLTGDADAYVFNFSDGAAMIYVDASGVIDLTSATAQPALNADTASYIVVDSGATKTYASMAYATGTTPTYTFTANESATGEVADIKSITLNAAGATVKTSFAAAVTATAEAGALFNVNEHNYSAASGAIEFAAAADGTTSTLTSGTVSIDSTNYTAVTTTTGGKVITATAVSTESTDNITVTVAVAEGAETVTLGVLDTVDAFSVVTPASGDTESSTATYTMTAAKYLVDATASEIYTIDTTARTYTLGTAGAKFIALDSSTNLALSDTAIAAGDYVVVNNAMSEVYQSLTIAVDETAGNTYTFSAGAESATTAIAAIQLGAVNATVNGVAFATNVTTPASGTNTYTIGSTAYKADSDALTIAIAANGDSSLSAGSVEIGAETLAITGDTVGVVVTGDTSVKVHAVAGADGAASTVDSITNLTDAGKVEYAGATYEMVGTVLKITAADSTVRYYDYSTTDASEAANILDAPNSNIAYVQINSATVDLASGTALITGDVTKVIYGAEENYVGNSIVELQNNNGTYALTQGKDYTADGAAIVNASGMDTATALVLTTAFAATVNAAQSADITVNGSRYVEAAASSLTIAATYTAPETEGGEATSGATLVEGTVIIGDTNPASVAASDGSLASATSVVNVYVTGGSINTIQAIDTSDTFTYNATASDSATAKTYLMADAGLLVSDGSIWDNTEVTVATTNGEISIDNLTSAANWTKMIAVSDSTLTLTDVTDTKLIIVDNTTNPATNYGNVTYDATAGYTVTVTNGADDISTIAFGNTSATLTTAGLASVNVTTTAPADDATENATFVVNGETYVATSALTIAATAGDSAATSTLTSGTVVVATADAATASVLKITGGAEVSVTNDSTDGVVVTVASDSTVTSITGLSDGGVVVYDGITYTREGNKVSVVETVEGETFTSVHNYNYTALNEGNLLDLDPDTATIFVPNAGDTIDLSKYETGAEGVIYGTGDTYSSSTIIAELVPVLNELEDGTFEIVEGEFDLMPGAAEAAAKNITAPNVAGDIKLTIDNEHKFTNDLTFTTPAYTGEQTAAPTYTVNGTSFVPQAGETNVLDIVITATDDTAYLQNGIVELDSSKAEAGKDTVTLNTGTKVTANGTIVYAKAENGELTQVSGIDSIDDAAETFTVEFAAESEYAKFNGTYHKTDAGLFVENDSESEGYDKIVTVGFDPNAADQEGTLTFDSNTTLSDFLAVDENGALDLTVAKAQGTNIGVYSNDLSAKYAAVTYTADGGFTVTSDTNYVESGIEVISVAATADLAVTTDFVTSVATAAEGSSTFTINGDKYVANASAIEVDVTAVGENGTTSLALGAVKLTAGDSDTSEVALSMSETTKVSFTSEASTEDGANNALIVTIATSGEGENATKVLTVSDINEGESFTVDGTNGGTFDKTAVGLFKTVENVTTLYKDAENNSSVTFPVTADDWSAVIVLDTAEEPVAGSTNTIVISATEPGTDTTYINSDKTVKVAEYSGTTLTASDDSAGYPITLDAEGISFSGNFSASAITYGTIQLKVTDTESTFSITSDTSAAQTVSNATNITLLGGSINATTAQAIATAAEGSAITVAGEGIENFTVNLVTDETDVVTISGITTDATISLATGTAGSMVSKSEEGGKAITYVFKNKDGAAETFTQTFTLAKEDADGVEFTVDADGKVTKIDDLDENAVITITSEGITSSILVNGHKVDDVETPFTISDGNTSTIIGVAADKSDASILLEHEFYVDVIGAESMNVYMVENNQIGSPLPETAADVVVSDFGTIVEEDGISYINLSIAVSPTSNYPITIHTHNTDEATGENIVVTLRKILSSETKVYISELQGDGVYVKIDATLDTLTLAQLNGNTLEAFDGSLLEGSALPLSGSFGIPSGMKLIVNDGFEITTDGIDAEEEYANVQFGSETSMIHLFDHGMVVTGATEGVYVALDQDGVFSVNGVSYYSIVHSAFGTGAVVQSVDSVSKLYAGVVEIGTTTDSVSATVDLTGGETITAGEVVRVMAAEGAVTVVDGVMDNEVFTIQNGANEGTYTMYGLGLVQSAFEAISGGGSGETGEGGEGTEGTEGGDEEETSGDETIKLLQKNHDGLALSGDVDGIYEYTIEGADWETAVKLADAAKIDLTASGVTDVNLFINSDVSAIVAELLYFESDTTLTDDEGNEIDYTAGYYLNAGSGLSSDTTTITFGTGALNTDFSAVVTTTGDATVNGVAFDDVGEEPGLTIAATYENDEGSATLTEGTVQVTSETSLITTGTDEADSSDEVSVEGDADGIKVVVEGGKVTSITGLDTADGNIVTLNNDSYTMDANGRLVAVVDGVTSIYEGQSNETDLLAIVGDAFAYKPLDTTDTDNDTITIGATDTNVIFGTTPSYDVTALVAKLEITTTTTTETDEDGNETEVETSTYALTKDVNAADEALEGIKVNATAIENINLGVAFDAEVSTAGSATVNGVEYVVAEGAEDSSLTIAATYTSENESGATLTNGTVTVTDELTATAIESDTTTGGTVKFDGSGAAEANGVTVTVANGVIDSITDLNDGEIVEYGGDKYKRAGNQIVKYTEGDSGSVSDIVIFDVTEGSDPDITDLENGGGYMTITNAISLPADFDTDTYTFMVYGTETAATYLEDPTMNYFASLEIDENNAYVFTKNGAKDDIPGLTIDVEGLYTDGVEDVVMVAEFAATIKTAGTATVNGKPFTVDDSGNNELNLTIEAYYSNEDGAGASLTNGVVKLDATTSAEEDSEVEVTGGDTVKVTGGDDNIIVTVSETSLTSITGLDTDGGSVTYGNDRYTLAGSRLVVDSRPDSDTGYATDAIYDAFDTVAETQNILDLDNAGLTKYAYDQLGGDNSDTVTLAAPENGFNGTIFGTGETYVASDAAVLVTADSTTYTVSAEENISALVAIEFTAAGSTVQFDDTFTTDSNAITVKAAAADGDYTIGDDTYTAAADSDGNTADLEIAVTFAENADSGEVEPVTKVAGGFIQFTEETLTTTTDATVEITSGNGVLVKVVEGTVTSISSFNDDSTGEEIVYTAEVEGETVVTTYVRSGAQIIRIVGTDENAVTAIFDETDDVNLLELDDSTASRYIPFTIGEDDQGDATYTVDPTSAENTTTYFGTEPTYSSDTYYAKFSYDETNGYSLESNTALSDALENVTVTVGEVGTISVDFAASLEVTGSVSVNGSAFNTEDTAAELTVNYDGTDVTLTNGAVVVGGEVLSVAATQDDDVEGSGGSVSVSEGSINVTVADGVISSITGLSDAEEVTYTDSMGDVRTYQIVGNNQIVRTTTITEDGGDTITTIEVFDDGSEETDLIGLETGTLYLNYGDEYTIAVDENSVNAYYGMEDTYNVEDAYLVKFTAETDETSGETAYTVETTDSTSFGDNLLKVDFASADTPIENPAISFTGGLVAEVSTAGSATVNSVPFTASTITDDAGEESVSALTITAEADGSATLRDGSVEVVGAILTATVVNDDTETTGKTLDASNSDGVTAVVAEGVFTSITALTTDDEVVVFDGDTYTRQGNLITVTNDNGSTVYNVSTAEDGDPNLITLADDFAAIPYYPLTDENSNTVVLASDVTEFYCGVPAAFNASTYYAHAVLNDNNEYEFELNDGDEAETPASFAVDATAITEPAIVINIAAEITTAGTATVNGDTFTSTGEGLTINVAAGAEEPATTLFAGTVTVSDSLATTSDGDVTVAVAEGSESTPEVTVVVIDGTVTSITGTDDGETVVWDDKTYVREGEQIIVGDEIYNVDEGAGFNTNLADLNNAIKYIQIADGAINLNEDLPVGGEYSSVYYGNDGTYSSDTYFARLDVNDDGEYTFEVNPNGGTPIENAITIDATGFEDGTTVNITSVPFEATITTDGSANINGVDFVEAESAGAEESLTVNVAAILDEETGEATGEFATTLTSGTVVVDINNTLTTTGDQVVEIRSGNGVNVTVADGVVTSIVSFTDDDENEEVVNFDGKTYTYDGTWIIEFTPAVTDDDGNPVSEAETNLYAPNGDGTDDLLALGSPIPYIQIKEDNTITLNDTNPRAFYGTDTTYEESTYFAELNFDSDDNTYTFTRGGGANIDGLVIDASSIDNPLIEARFDYESVKIIPNGDATVNGKAFSAAEGLTIAPNAEGATLTYGTIQISALNAPVSTTYDGSYDGSGKTIELTADVEGGDGVTVVVGDVDDEGNPTSDGVVISITGLNSEGETVVFDGKTYQFVDGEIIVTEEDEEGNIAATKIYDATDEGNDDLLTLTGEIPYYQILDGEIAIGSDTSDVKAYYGIPAEYSKTTFLVQVDTTFNNESGEPESYTFTKNDGDEVRDVDEGTLLQITVGSFNPAITANFEADFVATGETVVVNEVEFTAASSDGALTIRTSADSATLKDGVVTVTESLETTAIEDVEGSGLTVTAESDTNGVTVTVADGVVSSITDLDDGATVMFNGSTYVRAGDQIVVDGTRIIENADTDTDILDENNESWNYVMVGDDNTISLEGVTGTTYYGKPETYSSDTYFARLDITTGEDEENPSTTYAFTANTSENARAIDDLAIDASAVEGALTVTTEFAAAITTAGTATVNGVTFTAAVDEESGEEGSLTIDATYADDTPSAVLEAGTVVVRDSLETASDTGVTGVTGGDESDGVIVTVADGVVTSITDLDDGESLVYDGKTYTGAMDGETLQVIVTETDETSGETSTLVYDVDTENEVNTDLLNLTGEIHYYPFNNDEDSAMIDLSSATTPAYFGADATYSADTYFAKLTVDADGKYTFTQNDDVEAPNLTINAGEVDNIDAPFAAEITTAGDATINGVEFNSADDSALVIASTADSATLTDGTVIVTDSLNATGGEAVTDVSEEGAVTITVAEGVITGAGDIAIGESFKIDNDTYQRTAAGLFKIAESSTVTVLESSKESTEENLAITLPEDETDPWNAVLVVDESDTLDLSEVTSDAYVVNADYTVKVADLTVGDEGEFTLAGTEDGDTILETVKLGSNGGTITLNDLAATVETAAGEDSTDATYTVNDVSYHAVSALSIAAAEGTSTLTDGTVRINSSDDNTAAVTVGAKTITSTEGEVEVTAADGAAGSVSGLNSGGTFTVVETVEGEEVTDTYQQTGIGLIKNVENDPELLADSVAEEGGYTYNFEDESNVWAGIVILGEDGVITITEDMEDTIFVNSEMTAIAGTYADGTLTAGDGASDVTGIVLEDGVESVVFTGYTGTPITSGEAQFTVSSVLDQEAEQPVFTVTGTNIDGASEVALTAGTITVNEGAVTTADGNTVQIGNGGYTIGLIPVDEEDPDGAKNVVVTDVAAQTTAINVDGDAIVSIASVTGETDIVYTVGEQTFTIQTDAAGNPFTFTIEGGVVTAINGLDENATLVIQNNGSDTFGVYVNNHAEVPEEDPTADPELYQFEIAAGRKRSFVGSINDDGEEDVVVIGGSSFYIVYNGEGSVDVFGIDAEGNIDTGSSLELDQYATVEGNTITLNTNRVPGSMVEDPETGEEVEVVAVIANTTGDPISVQMSGGAVYVSGLTSVGDSLGIQILDAANLKVVSVADNTLADVENAPTAGTVGLPAGSTLTVAGEFKISASDNEGEVTFGDSTTLNGSGMAVVSAPEAAQFVLAAAAEDADALAGYTVNGTVYNVVEDATVDATADGATLSAGKVEIADSVELSDGSTVTFTGAEEGSVLRIAAVDGSLSEVDDINVGESFTITDGENTTTTYTMTALGLLRDDGTTALWTGAEITDGGFVTAEDLANAENWTGLIEAANGELTIDSSIESDSLVVDSVSNLTKIYGTVTVSEDGGFALTTDREDGDSDAKLTSIAIEGVAVDVAADFANIPVTAGGAQFTVTETATEGEGYTVDATGGVASVDGANALSLEDGGTVAVSEGTAVTTLNGTFSVSAGGYTITAGEDYDSVRDITASDVTITADGTVVVNTVALDNETVTYTVGDQTFTFSNEANDGVGLVIESGVVTMIEGLDINAEVEVTNNGSDDYTVAVNDGGFSMTVGANDSKSAVGTGDSDGADAVQKLTSTSFVIEVDGDTMMVFQLGDEVALDEGTAAQYFSFDSNTNTISIVNAGLVPSEESGNIILIKNFSDDELVELAESIEQHGLIQAIVVRKVGERYQLISGERRTRASKLAGLATIKAQVYESVEDKAMAEWALIENIQRVDLNPVEIARSYQRENLSWL